jgi:hypothetical protein
MITMIGWLMVQLLVFLHRAFRTLVEPSAVLVTTC